MAAQNWRMKNRNFIDAYQRSRNKKSVMAAITAIIA